MNGAGSHPHPSLPPPPLRTSNRNSNINRSIDNNSLPPHPTKSKSTNLASCAVATVFLLAIAATAAALYFFLFKPKPPLIAVNAIQFPTFSLSNGTVNFEFFQYLTVTNPNRDDFSHYDSSLLLLYSGQPVGVVFIPAGKIVGGGTQKMSAKFDLHKYPARPASSMEIETRMKLAGRVRVLKVFMHRVESRVKCGVSVEPTHGTVLAFRC